MVFRELNNTAIKDDIENIHSIECDAKYFIEAELHYAENYKIFSKYYSVFKMRLSIKETSKMIVIMEF